MITLLPFHPPDIPRLLAWVTDAEMLLQWAGPAYHYPLDEDQLTATWKASCATPPQLLMCKAQNEAGEIVGHLELLRLNPVRHQVTLGRVLIGPPELRNSGLGKHLVNAGLKVAFQELGYTSVELGVFAFNLSAIHVYKTLGFEKYLEKDLDAVPHPKFTKLIRMQLHRSRWKNLEKELDH